MAEPSTASHRSAVSSRVMAGAFALDVVLVVVFAVIGRASHDEDLTVAGAAQTAWPFLVGLVLGWLLTRAWRAPLAILPTGIGVWLLTVAAGMLLRGVTGQGVALAFVIVASIVLLVFLVGWRVIAALIRRGRSR
ncbi:DUF3054 domain-containing protein [Microbacterium sp. NPDC019599]|uniref:DUF3054 domain-containing protein n=1 Tax=Microbacterium sp. NPDC019599 TaxID=3154690 RepID=UPI0033E92137